MRGKDPTLTGADKEKNEKRNEEVKEGVNKLNKRDIGKGKRKNAHDKALQFL
jgi:hypothetical protein